MKKPPVLLAIVLLALNPIRVQADYDPNSTGTAAPQPSATATTETFALSTTEFNDDLHATTDCIESEAAEFEKSDTDSVGGPDLAEEVEKVESNDNYVKTLAIRLHDQKYPTKWNGDTANYLKVGDLVLVRITNKNNEDTTPIVSLAALPWPESTPHFVTITKQADTEDVVNTLTKTPKTFALSPDDVAQIYRQALDDIQSRYSPDEPFINAFYNRLYAAQSTIPWDGSQNYLSALARSGEKTLVVIQLTKSDNGMVKIALMKTGTLWRLHDLKRVYTQDDITRLIQR
jgi:hypothetical protein